MPPKLAGALNAYAAPSLPTPWQLVIPRAVSQVGSAAFAAVGIAMVVANASTDVARIAAPRRVIRFDMSILLSYSELRWPALPGGQSSMQ
ncbi:unannotated protein [freshwater metagenome]|uniref:Unannotated protein n=1 Tax=freshwater metagenome TaxID=449393 RepID=A0A6J7VC73_9ZZZZ